MDEAEQASHLRQSPLHLGRLLYCGRQHMAMAVCEYRVRQGVVVVYSICDTNYFCNLKIQMIMRGCVRACVVPSLYLALLPSALVRSLAHALFASLQRGGTQACTHAGKKGRQGLVGVID